MADLGDHILSEIPAAERLGFRLVDARDGGARSKVSLAPNLNHLGTFFGGSLYAAGALTCYAGLRALLESEGLPAKNIVIARGDIHYLAPAQGDIEIVSHASPESVRAFLSEFRTRGRGRIKIEGKIFEGLKLVAKIRGAYLARAEDKSS